MVMITKKMVFWGVGIVLTIAIVTNLVVFVPPLFKTPELNWDYEDLIQGTASTHNIVGPIHTSFGTYNSLSLEYSPSINPTKISENLANVDLQGVLLPFEIKNLLETYGFALVDEGYETIYEIYDTTYDENPKFITTDICLHAYHVLYDISLRVLEGENFFYDFEQMLLTLRSSQISLNTTVTEAIVHDALNKNIAYLSVMLYLLNNTNTIPTEVEDLTNLELVNIENGVPTVSAIFGYDEDFTQYKVRGHYTRNEILSNYFKAMMYAGRISFRLQSPTGDLSMGIEHTRMALLLISSFNSSETVLDLFDKVYEPTVFYVGASDDLTTGEYCQIWQEQGAPEGDELAEETVIVDFIERAKTYRKPQINSMFIYESFETENVTQGFRLMGQRFIPDSYIFQQLVHNKVYDRMFPSGLDVFSVFGSPRAALHMQPDNRTYSDYNNQILKLRKEFGNLTDYDWTQNLYWLWLYTLFPLLQPAKEGYPGFMISDAWTDKALMTALGSWTELRHDTILYAKQSYTLIDSSPTMKKGYVEPYPELYARLASLVRLMFNGLNDRNLLNQQFYDKLTSLAEIFDNLVTISIKELENQPLNDTDIRFIHNAGSDIADIASYDDPDVENWVSGADDMMAVIADVHTDPNSGQVLEEGSGNPYVLYVIVQDCNGELRIARGGTFSYYEFKHPMEDRLTDEEWHDMLDTNPPPIPTWMHDNLPIIGGITQTSVIFRKE
ncbi:MAG: DUF3160 domain-containing protein [Candidatus Heimdallarchaeaceae archaeon]